MKTMNNFKGTPGEFEINRHHIQVNPSDPAITSNVAMMYGKGEEMEANARLFANSKKVLEAAIEAHRFVCESLAFRAAQLGARPDQINDFIESHPFRKKLEQVINDSL